VRFCAQDIKAVLYATTVSIKINFFIVINYMFFETLPLSGF